jgi:hypothetical protein
MPNATAYGLADLYSMTRPGKRCVYNALGALEELANNSFGLTYDPTTLAPAGLLIEDQTTNFIRNTRCEGIALGVVSSGGTLPTNWNRGGGAAPVTTEVVGGGTDRGIPYVDIRCSSAGITSGDVVTFFFEIGSTFPVTLGDWSTFSIFLSVLSGEIPTGGGSTTLAIQELDTAFGTLRTDQLSITIPKASAVPFPDSRISSTTAMQTAGVAFSRPYLRINPGLGVAFDFVLRIGQPQSERYAFPSSPTMPPAGAPAVASRLAETMRLDMSKIAFANLGSSVVFRGRIGTLARFPGAVPAFRGLFNFHDGTSTNYMAAAINYSGALSLRWAVGGSAAISTIVTGLTEGQEIILRMSWGPNFVAGSVNGGPAVVGALAGTPLGLNGLALGCLSANGSNRFHGTIAQFDIIPRTVSAAELPTLSA